MRWYLDGKIGQQMEDFIDGDYSMDDEEILHIAKTDGLNAFKELIAEQEAGIQEILQNDDRDLDEICDLHEYSGYLVKSYQNVRLIELRIEKREKYLKKQNKKSKKNL